MRRDWPLWVVVDDLDPTKLRVANKKPLADFDDIEEVFENFEGGPIDNATLLSNLQHRGFARRPCDELIKKSEEAGQLHRIPGKGRAYQWSLGPNAEFTSEQPE